MPVLINQKESLQIQPLTTYDFNSFAPGWCSSDFKNIIPKHMLWIKFMKISRENVLEWMPQSTFDDKSTLVEVITLSWQYLNQSWP